MVQIFETVEAAQTTDLILLKNKKIVFYNVFDTVDKIR